MFKLRSKLANFWATLSGECLIKSAGILNKLEENPSDDVLKREFKYWMKVIRFCHKRCNKLIDKMEEKGDA